MSTSWQNDSTGDILAHLTELRRTRRFLGTRRGPGRCRSCKGARRVVLVDDARRVLYSEPCLACTGEGTSETTPSP
ncbi:hypothetical protein ACF09L_32515 [Streptomyces sp. NPDC014779]|uniref:hypothetical protein n=1 Tax=Streptomyces sp. NPDC014779 TaxID=3364911 RepID=UPI0037026DD3